MAKLPRPPGPDDLAERAGPPDVAQLGPGHLLARIYRGAGSYPCAWGTFRHYGPVGTARFDHHFSPAREQERAIYYAADTLQTAVAEAFGAMRVVDRCLGDPWLAAFRLTRPVRLCDLSGTWPTRAGAIQAISTGRRDLARAWSRAIYDAFPDLDGLLYRSSMDGAGVAVALWERASDAMPARPALNIALSHPGLLDVLGVACERLGYRLV
ncbi:MAG: RES family NAD+ phosphorylase [Acidimicrobiales bacterium]